MTMPVELIILSLPDKLRFFILDASLKNRHYSTSRIFLDSEADFLIKRLLYAVDWDLLKGYMFEHHGLSGNRPNIIDRFITNVNPSLVETVISIHEMYQNYDTAKFLRRLVQAHKLISNRLLSEEIAQDRGEDRGSSVRSYRPTAPISEEIAQDRGEDERNSYIDPDFYHASYTNDPFNGVDWGDPSTFNEAAWDQINDRD
jgi:hypothetical protein